MQKFKSEKAQKRKNAKTQNCKCEDAQMGGCTNGRMHKCVDTHMQKCRDVHGYIGASDQDYNMAKIYCCKNVEVLENWVINPYLRNGAENQVSLKEGIKVDSGMAW